MSQVDALRRCTDLPGVAQIGVAVNDIDRAMENLSKLFGVGPWHTMNSKRMRIAIAQLGPVQLELIQPLEGHTIYHDHLATKGEGLHHLGFVVSDFEEKVAALKEQGIPVLVSGPVGDDGAFAYMDTTKSAAGIIFELVKAAPSTLEFFEKVRNSAKKDGT